MFIPSIKGVYSRAVVKLSGSKLRYFDRLCAYQAAVFLLQQYEAAKYTARSELWSRVYATFVKIVKTWSMAKQIDTHVVSQRLDVNANEALACRAYFSCQDMNGEGTWQSCQSSSRATTNGGYSNKKGSVLVWASFTPPEPFDFLKAPKLPSIWNGLET